VNFIGVFVSLRGPFLPNDNLFFYFYLPIAVVLSVLPVGVFFHIRIASANPFTGKPCLSHLSGERV
jgi:hypothetical protein